MDGTQRGELNVQSAVDSTVVCDTMERYMSEEFEHIMMFSGDGDLAPVFQTCNCKLRNSEEGPAATALREGQHGERFLGDSVTC